VISVAFQTPLKQDWESVLIKLHISIARMNILVSHQAVHPTFCNKIAPMCLCTQEGGSGLTKKLWCGKKWLNTL